MSIQRIVLGFFACTATFFGSGQSDMSAWIGVDTKYDFNKKWSLDLEVQSRTDLKVGRMDAFLLSSSLSWKPIKFFEVGVAYRLTSVPYSQNTTNRVFKNRLTLDLTFQKIEDLFDKKSRMSLSLRLRGTTEAQLEKRTENTLRLNAKMDYDLPNTKLDLTASTEVFYRFQRDLTYTFSEVIVTNAINRYRLKLGMSYPLGDRHKLELFGIEQFNFPDKGAEFVMGMGYTYDFSPQKKSKKK